MTDVTLREARFAAVLRARREKEFYAARRHSALVRFLRWGLPAAGVMAMAVFTLSYMLTSVTIIQDFGPVTGSVTIERGEKGLVMKEPRITGTSADGQPFQVEGSRAWQDPNNPKVIHFVDINAELGTKGSGDGRTYLTADKGIYDTERETLKVIGAIRIRSTEGYGAEMEEVFVDMATSAIKTSKPLVLETTDMRIEASAANGNAGSQRIEFLGPVRMTIRGQKDAAGTSDTGGRTPSNATAAAPPVQVVVPEN